MHPAKTPITSPNAPAPVGPYSVAIRSGGLLFCSGQIGLDPKTQTMVSGGVEAEAKQVLENLKAVLIAAGGSLECVVKTTIFLKSMADFPKVNSIYAEYFKGTPPARSTIAVSELPKGALVEIDAIAVEKAGH